MSIFVIADLHLSFSSDKPMDIFGDHWTEHSNQVKNSWTDLVKEEDWVLIPGDISWALRFEEAKSDLDWICNLPGKKLMLRGNHDYWWSTLKKMSDVYPDVIFLQNNCHEVDDIAICGTRGWMIPGEQGFSEEHDFKIYNRELMRLKLSLEEGIKKNKELIVVMHFPPCTIKILNSGFTELFEQYGVRSVYYGHVHANFDMVFQGVMRNVEYKLVSADYLNFTPLKVR